MRKIIKLKEGDIVPENAKFLGEGVGVSHYIADTDSSGDIKIIRGNFFFYEITTGEEECAKNYQKPFKTE